ncbi:aminotransferase class V-fold PLP-dependent enzyme [Thalassoglobus polymorphus]|uniref:aminotransferase class V-fold PLP-dependent enzyme n=1 Tax=Thalassoglobus polymorphus TaxID=2527994 RepID=UPI0018D248B4|nr:aminotransferase class V-fold PLP-dependent enzyme [Thalassoglobus polymorphus]
MSTPSNIPALSGGEPVLPNGPPAWPISDAAIQQVFTELQASGAWGKYHAEHTTQLVKLLKAAYQAEHVLLTSSGTAAVELALRGLKISNGDEVILAAYDFKANFINVTLLGATPVLVDISKDDGQLDVAEIEQAISPQTKAILTSHLHGGMVDMPKLREVAQTHGLSIIEDCCQTSSQASIDKQSVGKFGDVAVLSFGGSKLLSAGRGGAVLTCRDDIAQRIRLYTQRGNEAYPLSEMQAAILEPQLDQLRDRHQRRLEAVTAIRNLSDQLQGLCPFSTRPETTADYYKLGFWYDADSFAGLSRETFCRAMRAEGIPFDPGFAALHRIHSRRRFRQAGRLEHADAAHESLVILHHPFLLQGAIAAQQLSQALEKIKAHPIRL